MSEASKSVVTSLARDDFDRIKKDPRFVRVVQLGRIVNALRYTHIAGATASSEADSSARRQRIASFLYVSGVLYEGFRLADVLGRDFATSTAFREGLGPLLKKPEVVALRQGVLNELRNKAVFHNDDEVMRVGLDLVQADPVVFFRAHGGTWGTTHYDLSDLAVLTYAFRNVQTGVVDELGTLRLILDVALEFGNCAESLIGEVLFEMGWKRREEDSA